MSILTNKTKRIEPKTLNVPLVNDSVLDRNIMESIKEIVKIGEQVRLGEKSGLLKITFYQQ